MPMQRLCKRLMLPILVRQEFPENAVPAAADLTTENAQQAPVIGAWMFSKERLNGDYELADKASRPLLPAFVGGSLWRFSNSPIWAIHGWPYFFCRH